MDVFIKISTVNGDPDAGNTTPGIETLAIHITDGWDAGHAIAGAPCAGHAIAGNWVAGKAIAGNLVAGYGGSSVDRPIVPARRKSLDVCVESWLKFSAAAVIRMYVITNFIR
jgi:hypothetical protein